MINYYGLIDEETAIAQAAVGEALASSELDTDSVDIDISMVDAETIRELNRANRNIDMPTDVLTFPSVDFKEPFNKADYSGYDFNPETGALILGEIIIARSVMLKNAEEYGHSAERECAYLITHGMMHLFGLDHIEDSDRAVMRAREEAVLNKLGITRDN